MGFRVSEADSVGLPRPASPAESLLLWGGVDEDGGPFLDPAFVVEAPPQLPAAGGQYLLTGRDAGATDLFSLSFDMPEVSHGESRGDGGRRSDLRSSHMIAIVPVIR